MNIQGRERELEKRWAHPYRWGGVQKDHRDQATNFIYRIPRFDDVLAEINKRFGQNPQYDAWSNYALNRWYNFWSARAVEEIFCSLEGVTPAKDKRDRLVDFSIGSTRFDHKTSIFPKGFGRDLSYALNRPQELIEWLYRNQSQEGRKHLKNRLFIVLHAGDGEHWKLRAEISWLKTLIETYVEDFDPRNLYRFSFEGDVVTLSDIIWAVK
jgi:hypothetical protein